jgi:hypothetical protein
MGHTERPTGAFAFLSFYLLIIVGLDLEEINIGVNSLCVFRIVLLFEKSDMLEEYRVSYNIPTPSCGLCQPRGIDRCELDP